MNRAKAKGTALESALVTYLKSRGHDARRVALAGALDEGDVRVQNWPLVFECKNTKAITVGPVTERCLWFAIDNKLDHGVFGGRSASWRTRNGARLADEEWDGLQLRREAWRLAWDELQSMYGANLEDEGNDQ